MSERERSYAAFERAKLKLIGFSEEWAALGFFERIKRSKELKERLDAIKAEIKRTDPERAK